LTRSVEEESFCRRGKEGKNYHIPVSNVRLNKTQHVGGGGCESNEDTIEDLTKTKDLKNLSSSGVDTVDTKHTR
jgi:hypothetical protein